jgi:uncharacterized protein YaiE (UPF0345 family)
MLPGEYVFNTAAAEIMEILSGELDVLLPGDDWLSVVGGQVFNVPENAQFTVRVHQGTDYICSFLN